MGILCRQSVGQGRRRWEMFARPWVTFVDHFGGSPLAQCRCRGRLGDIVPSQTLLLATIPQCSRKSRDLMIDVTISAAGWSQSSSGCQWLWIARDLVPLESWGLGQEAYKALSLLSKEDLQSLTSPPKGSCKTHVCTRPSVCLVSSICSLFHLLLQVKEKTPSPRNKGSLQAGLKHTNFHLTFIKSNPWKITNKTLKRPNLPPSTLIHNKILTSWSPSSGWSI